MSGIRKRRLYLGLDTSAYTTSLALVDQDLNLLLDRRIQLKVGEGMLGLRQQEAVFAHLNNLPRLLEEEGAVGIVSGGELKALAAAEKPRPVEGSYMPVFKVGEACGLFLTRTAGLAYLSSTHQEGHIMAGLWSAGLFGGRYLVLHLSGGTTEIVAAEETVPGRLSIKFLGGSDDLQAGQFVDRIGRVMGLPFPAGPALEALAATLDEKEKDEDEDESNPLLPVAVRGTTMSFSGPASHAERLLQKGCRHEKIARAVEICIADTLIKAVSGLSAAERHNRRILAVGGVTANGFIRRRLKEKLGSEQIFFAAPQMASDNAVGLAVQAARMLESQG